MQTLEAPSVQLTGKGFVFFANVVVGQDRREEDVLVEDLPRASVRLE